MRCPDAQILWLPGLLLVGCMLLTPAHTTGRSPVTTRVIATIMAIDPTTGLTALQTEQGEQFALPTAAGWKVGERVSCERIGDGSRTRLRQCRPWP